MPFCLAPKPQLFKLFADSLQNPIGTAPMRRDRSGWPRVERRSNGKLPRVPRNRAGIQSSPDWEEAAVEWAGADCRNGALGGRKRPSRLICCSRGTSPVSADGASERRATSQGDCAHAGPTDPPAESAMRSTGPISEPRRALKPRKASLPLPVLAVTIRLHLLRDH